MSAHAYAHDRHSFIRARQAEQRAQQRAEDAIRKSVSRSYQEEQARRDAIEIYGIEEEE